MAEAQLSLSNKSAIHTSAVCCRVQSGRYRITTKRNRPLTYEMANPPHFIGHRKSWNSWNTCKWLRTANVFYWTYYIWFMYFTSAATLKDALRPSQTAIEDVFLRKFITGTWHGLVCSEVIIKRQHNTIRIAAIIRQAIPPRKMYFLIGYTEELLSYWMQCPVTMELQTVADKKDVVFKYI